MTTWRDHIQVEQLPELYRSIADAIGRDAMIELATRCQKVHLYLKQLPDDFTHEHLSEDYLLVSEAIGMPATLALAAAFPGEFIYLMAADLVFLPAKQAYVRAEFNGRNHRRLALNTGLSIRHIYEILAPPVGHQLTLPM